MFVRGDLVVKVIEIRDEVKASEIALQAWNIKREFDRRQDGSHFDIMFLEGTDRVRVKHTNIGNIDEVVDSWGKVVNEEAEIHISLDATDLTKEAGERLDSEYEFLYIEGMSGDITITFDE